MTGASAISGLDETRSISSTGRLATPRAQVEHLQSEIAGHRSRIEFNRQRTEEIRELITRARVGMAAAETKRDQQQAQMKDVNALIEKTAQLLQSKQTDLARPKRTCGSIAQDAGRTGTRAANVAGFIVEARSRIGTLEDEIAGIGIRRETTVERLRELDTANVEAQKGRDRALAAISAAREATESEKQHIDLLLAEIREIETNLVKNREQLGETEKNLIVLEGFIAEKKFAARSSPATKR